jgi:hypothetical protein
MMCFDLFRVSQQFNNLESEIEKSLAIFQENMKIAVITFYDSVMEAAIKFSSETALTQVVVGPSAAQQEN